MKAVGRVSLLALILIIPSAGAGCGTTDAWMCPGTSGRTFGGVKRDIEWINGQFYDRCTGEEIRIPSSFHRSCIMPGQAVVDLPFSLIFDIVLFPFALAIDAMFPPKERIP